jgi:hypothetical protein
MVQMAAGMTRLLAVAVLKAAEAAEKVVEATGKKRSRSRNRNLVDEV